MSGSNRVVTIAIFHSIPRSRTAFTTSIVQLLQLQKVILVGENSRPQRISEPQNKSPFLNIHLSRNLPSLLINPIIHKPLKGIVAFSLLIPYLDI